MHDDNATLSVGFEIDTGSSFSALQSLDDLIGKTAADAVREFQRMEQISKGAINLGGATASVTTFGAAATRELQSVAVQTARTEKAAEAMVRQIERQTEVFGKSASEVRNMRAEFKAAAADAQGLTELAARLRATNAALVEMEAAAGGAAHGSSRMSASGMEMMHVARASSDAFAAGAPIMQIFSMEIGRVAQAAAMAGGGEGALGKIGAFLGGPWGMALTVGIAVLGPLVAKLWENDDAAKKAAESMKKFQDRQSEIGNFIDTTTGKLTEQNRTLQLNAILTRQKEMKDNATLVSTSRDKTFELARSATKDVGGNPMARFDSSIADIQRIADPDVEKAIAAAGGNIDKLTASVAHLAQTTRPDLGKLALDMSTQASQAVIAQRENEKLSRELRALGGDTDALSRGTTALINRQVEAAAATTGVQKAQAALNEVRAHASAIDHLDEGTAKAAALVKYRNDLTAATLALNKAQGDVKGQRDAAKAQREVAKEEREAAKVQRELDNALGSTLKKLDPLRSAMKDYSDQLAQIAKLEGAKKIGHFEANDLRDDAQVKLDAERTKLLVGSYSASFKEAIEGPLKIASPTLDLWQDLSTALGEIPRSFEEIAKSADVAGTNMAQAFGRPGAAMGQAIKILGEYGAKQDDIAKLVREHKLTEAQGVRANSELQLNSLIGLTDAAKGLFSEHSKGYKAMEAAEKALTIVQLARTAVDVAGGAARMFASLGPLAFPAVAAMLGVMASLGFGGGGAVSQADYTKGNDGTGTVLGDSAAKSDSIKRSIDALKAIDDVTLTVSRDMLTSLQAIESNIGGLASLLVRTGNIDASAAVQTGFKTDTLGKALGSLFDPFAKLLGVKIPILSDILGGIAGVVKSLFGTKTTIVGSGIFGGEQSVSDILASGFNTQYYSDVQKKKKFLGLTTSTKYDTDYAAADPEIASQFTLLITQFYNTVAKAAGPLGQGLDAVKSKLLGFTVDLGKIDLMGLSGDEIQAKLEAVFGAAADDMAKAGVPGLEKFQQVGEGYFATLVRVSSTVAEVDATFQKLGRTTGSMGIDVDMAIAGMFDSLSSYTSATNAYFETYYSAAEQAAANAAQMAKVFGSLNVAMPDSLAGFRALVEAQDLTTDAGRSTYATLLQIAPAFASLESALNGAKSAADVLAEREDLNRQLLEAQGNTAALRALDLAKLDESNRGLQEQIYAVQDAKAAADAATALSEAWKSVGDSIVAEINRIRGLTDAATGGGFATLQGQFNAATAAARRGDQDAAKSLPQLSQALLTAAAAAATSRQELDRVQALTAASLEATNSALGLAGGSPSTSSAATLSLASAQVSGGTSGTDLAGAIQQLAADLREEIAQLRNDNNAGQSKIASVTGSIDRRLDAVTQNSGGTAISVAA